MSFRYPQLFLVLVALSVVLNVPAVTAQQPSEVNIQTTGARSADGTSVIVSVDRSRVRVNELVIFTLTPADVVLSGKYNVTIDFGDGTRRQVRGTQVRHKYAATGHYKVFASVSGVGPSSGKDDKYAPVPRVTLSANPNRIVVGKSVDFRAQLSSSYPGLMFRFSFGDGTSTDWQNSAQANHTYRSAGTYLPYVDIGSGGTNVRQLGGSVRQQVVVTLPPLGQVQLAANPSAAEAGSSVTLTARIASTDPSLRYRFRFGDGSVSDWQPGPQTTHIYTNAGNYAPVVDVGFAGSNTPISSGRSAVQITPRAGGPSVPFVALSASPAGVEMGQRVTFNARVNSPGSNLKYRFVYGDGARTSGWQDSAQSSHSYSGAGNFSAYVEIARSSRGRLNPIGRSAATAITVTSGGVVASASPSPSPTRTGSPFGSPSPSTSTDPGTDVGTATSDDSSSAGGNQFRNAKSNWWYLPLLLLLLPLGYWLWKWVVGSTVSAVAHADLGNAQLAAGAEGFSIESEVILRPDIGNARYDVSMNEAVVKNLRRENV